MKIVVMGASNVGKSDLVSHLYGDSPQSFPDKNNCKIPVAIKITVAKKFCCNGGTVICDIQEFNTSGKEETELHDCILKGDGFILVYDISATKLFSENCPILLVGNKVDLVEKKNRKASTKCAKKMAKELGCKFLVTSATNGSNVVKAFETMAKLIKDEKSRNDKSKSQ